MFKLFKELTRPPEPLIANPSHSAGGSGGESPANLAYTPRQRGRSLSTSLTRALEGQASQTSGTKVVEGTKSAANQNDHKTEEDAVETNGDAKKVVELLKDLDESQGVMSLVEGFSQLPSLPGHTSSLRAFRRHRGFAILTAALKEKLIWKPPINGLGEETHQVMEVQRIEGIRLALESLGWALGDRHNLRQFESEGGYAQLLPALRKLSPPSSAEGKSDASEAVPSYFEGESGQIPLPNPKILSLLLAHIFNNHYSLISLVDDAVTSDLPSMSVLSEKLGEPALRYGSALPTLWAYMWGIDNDHKFAKGKKVVKGGSLKDTRVEYGYLEGENASHAKLIQLSFRILLVAASASTTNLLVLRDNLPNLTDFLLTRLYCPEKKRKYETTFPATHDWYTDDDSEETTEEPVTLEWKAPSSESREIYLQLLRRLLEAGVNQPAAWRLFSLIRTTESKRRQDAEKPVVVVTNTPSSPTPAGRNGNKRDHTAGEDDQLLFKTKKRPQLHLDTVAPPAVSDSERLDPEVLDLVRHAMKSRHPDVFAFRGSTGYNEGGIESRDLGRPWPTVQKGFNFSTWLYITKLNHPVVLLHVTQSKKTVFRIRILENSQIGLQACPRPSTSSEEAEEVVCPAPDALVPHLQWVHFSVNCRKVKSQDIAEFRIFVNGVRVGAMRLPYPAAAPLASVPAPQLHVRPASPADAIKIGVGRSFTGPDPPPRVNGNADAEHLGRQEENEWLLGRVLLLEEAVSEDFVLLLHHLGPRYHGNLQEPVGKFLTYQGATSINVYLSSLGQSSTDKRLFTMPNTSILVKAIRAGLAIPEEHILLSFSARDVLDLGEHVVNAAVPHPIRAKQLRHGLAHLVGNLEAFRSADLDEAVSTVGGGTVVLKLVDMAQTAEELASTLSIMRDMLSDSWSASEEMERIRGFELLAAILRPKMPNVIDITCTKIIMAMLGISMDKPAAATVINSVAYRALGLEFELWAHAPLGVTSLYLEHFQYLLVESKHRRFNLLRTFQKSAMVRKLLYALRSGLFDPAVVPVVVDTLKIALEARWSSEDAIKPVFSYLVTALCQSPVYSPLSALSPNEPPPTQTPAALILSMIAELCSNTQRLVKLNKALALHRLLVVFISSNSAYYVVVPCLEIFERCLFTPGLESFQRSFETEGGFALLARTLGPMWRSDIQDIAFRIMLGPDEGKTILQCPSMLSTITSALETLLQGAGEVEEGASNGRPGQGRTRSGTITSIRSVAMTPLFSTLTISDPNGEGENRLTSLLKRFTSVYRTSPAFRKALTSRRIENLVPTIADFAAMSSSSPRPEVAQPQREAAASWLQAMAELGKLGHSLTNQIRLIQEQLQSSSSAPRNLSSSMLMSPPSPARPSSSFFGSSFTSRLGTTPPSSIPSSPTGSIRRRPSTEAGIPFNRTRSLMEKRMPLKRVLTNESVLEGGKDKNAAWKLIIIQTDSQKHAKVTLERKEHWQKLGEEDWPRQASQLRTENGLWPDEDAVVTWRLDGSEGPLRMRARLERVNAYPDQIPGKAQRKLRDAIPSVDELSSAVSRVNVAPWEDPFALSLGQAAPIAEEESAIALGAPKPAEPGETGLEERQGDDDSFVEIEEGKDDKMRRIAKALEAGDVVEEAHNIVRIVGVDACPGLLILGKKNLYLMDGLVQTPDGEVIDARDAPRDVLTIPSGTLVELDPTDQQSHRWSYNEIVESNRRAFLFRDVALEIYFSDKRNFLIVFRDKRQRQVVVQKLNSKNESRDAISRSVIGNFVLDQVARAIDKSEQQLEAMTRRWQSREISNFAYLQLLNQHANRTPNDVTQYPVFPWVLADYSSINLDFDKESTYRNLALPMGALTPARREAAVERYTATEGVGEAPFHYGTHYSSSMIVCGFMIRASPFTEIFLALQGGNFDLADRLFSSVPRAWDSASGDNRGDVRELIPEFYYLPSFLLNVNHHDFGKKQVSGEVVDDVVLPPWALGDASLFIHRHREALESEYVSRHLPAWIDLTFGWKQRDPASYNCFHPLSYRGAVDLEKMTDEGEKAASTAIIHNFGQTPEQIFKSPHPHRFGGGRSTLPINVRFGVAEGWQLLLRSIIPITETNTPIDDLVESAVPDAKPVPQQRHRLIVPGTHLSVQYGFTDDSLRVFYQDVASPVPRLVHLLEGISVQHAVFASPTLLVTVSSLGVLTAWRFNIKNSGYRRGDVSITREAILRGHDRPVTCVAASAAWSLLVSASDDGTAIVWDTNRLRYTRKLETNGTDPIKYCSVNESDGKIALVTATEIYMYSLNGHPFAHTNLSDYRAGYGFTLETPDENASTAAEEEFTGGISFLNREFLRFGVLFVIGVGSEIALYRCVPGEAFFEGQDVKPWSLEEQGRLDRSDEHAGGECSMVKFIGETLYAAFKPGSGSSKHSLYQWSLPEGNARHVSDLVTGTCMDERCGRHFGLLEPRRHCGGCGGAFCGTHAVLVENFSQRYCGTCRNQLAHAAALGLISNRKDSIMPSSRRGSFSGTGVPGSRADSRPPSRPVSRRGSNAGFSGPPTVAHGSGGGGGGVAKAAGGLLSAPMMI